MRAEEKTEEISIGAASAILCELLSGHPPVNFVAFVAGTASERSRQLQALYVR